MSDDDVGGKTETNMDVLIWVSFSVPVAQFSLKTCCVSC